MIMKIRLPVVIVISFVLGSCFDYEHKEIHLTRNICLMHSEGDTASYYGVYKNHDEHSSTALTDGKVVEAYCDSLNIFVKTLDWKKDTTFYSITLKSDTAVTPLVKILSKTNFVKKLQMCNDCKKVRIE